MRGRQKIATILFMALVILTVLVSSSSAQANPDPVFTGGALSSELVLSTQGLEFTETDDYTDCSIFSSTAGGMYFDDSDGTIKCCQDNVLSDCVGGAFTGSYGEMIDTGNTDAYVITEVGITESYHSNGVISDDLSGWTFDAGGAGSTYSITSIADAGGGDITVTTSADHGLAANDIVSHAGATDTAYEGVFQVLTVPTTTTYTVTATYTATDTATGQHAAVLIAGAGATGKYVYTGNFSGSSAGSNKEVSFQLFVNATPDDPPQDRKFGTGGDVGSWGFGGIVSVSSGDRISFSVKNLTDGTDITVKNLNLAIYRVAL